jgi:putative acetyltransferase
MDPIQTTLRDGTTLVVRTASVSDAEAIVALDRRLAEAGAGMVTTPDQVRTVAETRARIDGTFRGMSAGDATIAIVADLGGSLAGNADLKQLSPALCRHVGVVSVGVDPEHQRRGVGRALMNALVGYARACGLVRLELYVRSDNERAQALYRSIGFEHEGTRRRFVRAGDRFIDDYVYSLFL